uniref:CW7 repeat protein n=1 Tax=Herelleviridae sp. cti3G1 TaxID=2825831 RepID=A0A8S5U925_9CAUD|nr:MAG TPA: CW7 repeat protein [Herelleviridae sp. cti3G1]
MSFKQIIFPNLDDKKLVVNYQGKPLLDWFLWCLAVAQKTFNVAPFAATAQIAWNWNNTKHQDRNLPDGCFVPIWWTGGTGNYGHVAVAKRSGNRIQVWSSPYRHKPFFDYFEGELNATIDNISRIYGVVYAGWTETMNTTRIVEWVTPPQLKPNEEIAAEVWRDMWGKGQDRINRLTSAGYDWRTIQALIDKGVGKPVEQPKVEEVKPAEVVKPIEQPKTEDESKEEEKHMDKIPELTDDKIKQFNDAYQASLTQASGIIEEVGSGFDFSQKTKMIAYLTGDFLLLAGAITPQVILAIMSLNDKNLTAFGTALASILATLGSQILLIFKLLKKK